MEKKLYIIAGANGSGKTTFAKEFTQLHNLDFVNADEIAKEIDPTSKNGGELAAGRIFFKRIDELLKGNKHIVLESTLSGLYLQKLIKNVKTLGYSVEIIYIFLENPDVCVERIKERVLKGGHNVPTPDVIRRYYRSKNNFWKRYRLIADKWFLVYNSNLEFDEFSIGNKESFSVIDEVVFNEFMKDIEVD